MQALLLILDLCGPLVTDRVVAELKVPILFVAYGHAQCTYDTRLTCVEYAVDIAYGLSGSEPCPSHTAQ